MWNQVGPVAIQLSEIEACLRVMGIDEPATRMKYVRLIQTLDRVEREHIAKRKK